MTLGYRGNDKITGLRHSSSPVPRRRPGWWADPVQAVTFAHTGDHDSESGCRTRPWQPSLRWLKSTPAEQIWEPLDRSSIAAAARSGTALRRLWLCYSNVIGAN